MSSRGLIVVVGAVLLGLSVGAGAARSDEAVVLTRWADEGLLVSGRGNGPDVVRLIAEATWDRSASRDPARYRVRVAFPDGRVDSRPFPVDYPPGRSRFAVYVATEPIRNLPPSAVQVAVTVVDASSGTPVGNTLMAGIEDFPRPKGDASASDPGPFGWGKPLEGPIRILPNAGPDGLKFARIASLDGTPGLFIATTEATVAQVGQRLTGYDPKAGRSDEFALEDPSQPAINLTPAKAREYLEGLSKADSSGLGYRLPTEAEWTLAAKAGKTTAFWWGDEPTYPAGANLLGPEPALAGDATAPSTPPVASPTFEANPFGLAHTFGNAAEWATGPAGGFVRMGGHFRTEPAVPLPSVKSEKDDQVGPDPFVGVRPVVDLTPESASRSIKKRLEGDSRLARAVIAYDPDRALVTLSGQVPDPTTRREADRLLEGLWFVAAVENKLETSALFPDQMAILGPPTAPARRMAILDRTFVEVPLSIKWLDPLPVTGTTWWVNIYLPDGGHQATKLDPADPGKSRKVVVRVDREKLAAYGLADTSTFSVGLSIGAPAPILDAAKLATNLVEIRPTFSAKPR